MQTRTVHFKNGKVITVVGEVVLFNATIDKVRKVDDRAHYINQEEVLYISSDVTNA